MKRLSVRMPEKLIAQIAAEARARGLSQAQIIRERLALTAPDIPRRHARLDRELIGLVDPEERR